MDFSKLDGYEFEKYISTLLRNMGFVVEETTYSNDGGIDIIAIWEKPIFSGKYIIQCKNWQGAVGAPEVRDLYGVVMDQRANKGILITTSDFTTQAKSFADGKNLELLNGTTLQALISENRVQINNSETQKMPSTFNHDRFQYLKTRIEATPRESKYYEEMISFLREYIIDGQSVSTEILNLIIKYTESYNKKCLNTKHMQLYRIAEELNLATYLILLGRFDEALEISLNNDFFMRYEVSLRGNHNNAGSIFYGNDVITQNLYVVFARINYTNGIKIINNLPLKRASARIICDIDVTLMDNYKSWGYSQEIYSAPYYVSNTFNEKNIRNKLFEGNYLCIPPSWICDKISNSIKTELYNKLDKVFKQHGML